MNIHECSYEDALQLVANQQLKIQRQAERIDTLLDLCVNDEQAQAYHQLSNRNLQEQNMKLQARIAELETAYTKLEDERDSLKLEHVAEEVKLEARSEYLLRLLDEAKERIDELEIELDSYAPYGAGMEWDV